MRALLLSSLLLLAGWGCGGHPCRMPFGPIPVEDAAKQGLDLAPTRLIADGPGQAARLGQEAGFRFQVQGNFNCSTNSTTAPDSATAEVIDPDGQPLASTLERSQQNGITVFTVKV